VFTTFSFLPRLAKVSLLFGCVCFCGGHWAAFQMVAWAGMLVTYSAEAGFLAGAEKTFSGNSPCGLCERIAQAKEEQQGQTTTASVNSNKLEGMSVPAGEDLGPHQQADREYFSQQAPLISYHGNPPSPVPITA